MSAVLVVDDEKSMCDLLSIMLVKEGYEVSIARNGEAAVEILQKNQFDAVITDIKMPKSNGLAVLDAANLQTPQTPVIMMTAYASAETAVLAMKKGAFDYISKPFEIEELQLILKNAVEKKRLSCENTRLRSALSDKYQYASILGKSLAMQEVFDLIQKVAESAATILLQGESGTGKELAAKALHYNSLRRDKPFVSINCGALPETLLENELFGHEKGAFTGADSKKMGLIETANEGTFFLDEIYDAPLSIQVKLLRVLQERELTRVGGTQPIPVDVRIIAASNRDLAQGVKEKTFREDLFYRLKVISIHLPPLRDRTGDIPLLAHHFIQKFNKKHHRNPAIKGIQPKAVKILENYHWPGNVRELENTIERAVLLESGDSIQTFSLYDEIREESSSIADLMPSLNNPAVDLEKTLEKIEKRILLGALEQSNGIINKAAKILNLSFRSMRYRLQKHKLKGKDVNEK